MRTPPPLRRSQTRSSLSPRPCTFVPLCSRGSRTCRRTTDHERIRPSSANAESTADSYGAGAEPAISPKPKQRRWTRSVFALAACLAVLVGVGIGAVALNQQLNPPASVVALQEIEAAGDAQQATVELDDGGSATAHWSASAGKAVLVADGLPSPGDGQTYELWFVRGDSPVAAGVFDVDGGEATALLTGTCRQATRSP